MDLISEDVAKFAQGSEYLLSALAKQANFSETERGMIAYYCQEVMIHTQNLRAESSSSRSCPEQQPSSS